MTTTYDLSSEHYLKALNLFGIRPWVLSSWIQGLQSDYKNAVNIFLWYDLSNDDKDLYNIGNDVAKKWILGRELFYGVDNWSKRPIVLDFLESCTAEEIESEETTIACYQWFNLQNVI